jgi:sulfur relay (sulfurtransferase) DsrF/TusC family protein
MIPLQNISCLTLAELEFPVAVDVMQQANLRELFNKFDTNHNGTLEPPEVMNLFK